MPNIITFNDKIDFMMDNFEYKGYWYLPDCEDHQVAGILTFIANNSAILELIGDIDAHDEPLMAIFEQKSHTVIWGVNSDAKRITLLNCTLSENALIRIVVFQSCDIPCNLSLQVNMCDRVMN